MNLFTYHLLYEQQKNASGRTQMRAKKKQIIYDNFLIDFEAWLSSIKAISFIFFHQVFVARRKNLPRTFKGKLILDSFVTVIKKNVGMRAAVSVEMSTMQSMRSRMG